jgi:hypothetical protein
MAKQNDDDYSPEETARRRDAVLKVMVNTPPQPRTNLRRSQGKRIPTGEGRTRKASARQRKS